VLGFTNTEIDVKTAEISEIPEGDIEGTCSDTLYRCDGEVA